MTVSDKNKKYEIASYAYSYDHAGNKLTSTETIDGKEQTTNFTYDDDNRLLSMKTGKESITYEYDKNGNRVKQSGTDEVLDYIYYLTDARGSVTGMVQDGEQKQTNSYGVYGEPEESDDIGNPYGYTGEAQDITGYNYLRARYYDSQSGTFLTQDSYEGEEDNPLSQNGYTYVENNPINYSDPTGHTKSFWGNLWNGAKKAAKKVVNTVKSVAKKVYNTVKKIASNVYSTVKKVANSVWGGVKQAASYVYNGVRNTYNAVNKFFSGGETMDDRSLDHQLRAALELQMEQ